MGGQDTAMLRVYIHFEPPVTISQMGSLRRNIQTSPTRMLASSNIYEVRAGCQTLQETLVVNYFSFFHPWQPSELGTKAQKILKLREVLSGRIHHVMLK